MDFKEKVVLITGASSGIGAAAAIYFSKQSAKLALVSRSDKNLKRIALYCEKSKCDKPLTIIADLTSDADVGRVIDETIDHYGKINVLVNNAGVISLGGIKKTNMEEYDRVMSTNMRAVFQLTMLAVPHLTATKGCVVNVSCLSSNKANTMSLAYNISKAALDHFTKCTALELAADGIRVNSINPGFVRTNLYKDIGLTESQMELFVKNIIEKMPLKKAVEGDEVAGLIAFLSSDKAKSITGCCYVIDGGSSLR